MAAPAFRVTPDVRYRAGRSEDAARELIGRDGAPKSLHRRLRGVAALRYAGERVLSMEAEYRHPIHGNWDALVFAGSGRASSDFRGIDLDKTVSAAGVGIRFRAAKLFGLTFGLDFAQGPDGLVSYIQIGNVWTN